MKTTHINIISLHISTQNGSIKKDNITIDMLGIEGDKFYDKTTNRAVLITSTKAYDIMKQNGIVASFGSLGENILIDFDTNNLKEKDILTIDEVELQITQNCTICEHLSCIDKSVPKLLKHDRGIFAKVLKGGIVKSNSNMKIL